MFNSVVLDVFIGLVLLYLLYSLLVSIIGELIAGVFKLRQDYLRRAIEMMLNDKSVSQKWYKSLISYLRTFSRTKADPLQHTFAGKFFSHPSIKYLSPIVDSSSSSSRRKKPSYIARENFSSALIQLFRNKGIGKNDFEKISFCLKFNTLHIEPQTLDHLRNLLADSGSEGRQFNEKLIQWYEQTMDGVNGWFKGKMRIILFLLGFFIAMAFNVDSIEITQHLTTDKEARKQLVELGIQASDENSPIGKAIRVSGDSTAADSLLRQSYENTKKAADEASKVIGSGWNFEPLVTGYRIRRSVYPYTLQALLKQILEPAKGLKRSIRSYEVMYERAKNKAKRSEYNPVLKQKRDSLEFLIRRFNSITGSKFILTDTIGSSIQKVKNDQVVVRYSGNRHYNFVNKAWYMICQSLPTRLKFWGFVITALMLSLGAPFWFDLLKKLVSIRNAGVKPEEKIVNAKETNRKTGSTEDTNHEEEHGLIRPAAPGDLISEALRRFTPGMKKIPGVKSVLKGVKQDEGQPMEFLQVNVVDETVADVLRKRFANLQIEDIPVEMRVVVSGDPITHLSTEGRISNESGQNGFGSLGCVLKNKGSGNLHLLSCWHVMKGNTEYDTDDDFVSIIEESDSKMEIGKRWGGGIQGTLDYGLARSLKKKELDRNQWLKDRLGFSSVQYMPVSAQDINNQIPVCFYDIFTGNKVEGKIYTDSASVEIRYADRLREVEDVLLLTDPSGEKGLSQPGNSGSVVFNSKGDAIGMIIAGDGLYSYAIKLSNFFSLFQEMVLDS